MIRTLAAAIGYPEIPPEGASRFLFRVDGLAVLVETLGSRLVVRGSLGIESGEVATFATFAAGRMLREAAVLAWDERAGEGFLWQELPVQARGGVLAEAFGAFLDAYEWWVDRVEALRMPASVFPAMMIQP